MEAYGDIPYLHPEMDKRLAQDKILEDLRREMNGEIVSRKFDDIRNKMKARISEILEDLIRT